MIPLLQVWDPILKNIEIVMVLVIFVWLYSWAKAQLGSMKLAVLFALIVVYLTFWMFPVLIWILIGFFLIATFGKELLQKAEVYKE